MIMDEVKESEKVHEMKEKYQALSYGDACGPRGLERLRTGVIDAETSLERSCAEGVC